MIISSILSAALLAATPAPGGGEDNTVVLSTANTSMVFEARKGSQLKTVYYGQRLDNPDEALLSGYAGHDTYPAFGLKGTEETTVAMTHADGNITLDLALEDVARTPWENGETMVFTLKDRIYPTTVKVCFKSFVREDMIETWTEITSGEDGTVTLTRFDSGTLSLRGGDAWMTSFYGTWANEGRILEEPVQRGYRVIKNIDGTRNAHTSRGEVMISLDGKPQENAGRVIGAALCWGGNYELRMQGNDSDYIHFFAGICPENSWYRLGKGETFTTPVLALSFSDKGLGQVSRNFHRWGRKYMLQHGDKERKVLLNSWEGVYFDINEDGMARMMHDISSMGGELFVMDDGWFGKKYRRLTDNSSLGDWTVDRKKLPHGIKWLVNTAKKEGIEFGIWIEPEMTNTVSELYDKHPDWVIKSPGREVVTGRGGTQLVLDLSNPEVQDFVFGVLDGIMKENPEISYIKWDANMNISEAGSQYLDNQSHLFIDYWKGFDKVCERVRRAYPDLVIQDCASGGGRANWGVLKYFDEFWVSDNTDAFQRIYMQWGTSYFFPAIAMASHISATPNHTVFRTTSLKYRIDVAMSGRLGMEIQPANMTDKEKEQCRKAIAEYKAVRPVIQFGDLYRLVSPYDGKGVASLMYSSEEKDRAVFFWWRLTNMYDEHPLRVRMDGLDPDKVYTVKELDRIDVEPLPYEGRSFSGRFLMENGLEIPKENLCEYHERTDWSSRVLYLEAE